MKETAPSGILWSDRPILRWVKGIDWRRLLVFALGGLLLLLLMNMQATQMRERASIQSAALSQDNPFAPWGGKWAGSIQTSTPEGSIIAQVHATRVFGDWDGVSQLLIWDEAQAGGPNIERRGTQEIIGRQILRSVSGGPGGNETFTGRMEEGGTLTWTNDTDKYLTLIREWVDGSTYYVEGFSLQKGEKAAIVYHSGRLRRENPPQTGK